MIRYVLNIGLTGVKRKLPALYPGKTLKYNSFMKGRRLEVLEGLVSLSDLGGRFSHRARTAQAGIVSRRE